MSRELGDRYGRGEMASRADAEAIAGLVDRSMPHPWTRAQIEEAVALPEARWVIDRSRPGGDALGFVLGRRVASDLAEIDLVAVDPAARRQGVASRLLDAWMSAERRSGVCEIHLELAASNAPARALYAAAGFVVGGRRARYYPGGDDALLLSWRASPED